MEAQQDGWGPRRSSPLTNQAAQTDLPQSALAQLGKLLGRAPQFVQSCELLQRFGPSNVPVLIEGETGTGKELAARAIHYLSARHDKPFVPINCGALPDHLFENELFGHRAGAYTGATQASKGMIQQAEGGSLFLDEIEALSEHGQVALLRFVQNQEYRPLGGGALQTADVRVVAASNQSLVERVERGDFREDLYFRLAVAQVELPPLRQRPGDASLLADHFLQRISKRENRAFYFATDTLRWIERQAWKGNVRELENFVERCVLLRSGLEIRHGSEGVGGAQTSEVASPTQTYTTEPCACEDFNSAKKKVIAQFERDYLTELMSSTGGNVSKAAKLAGKERRCMGKLLKKHGIDARVYK